MHKAAAFICILILTVSHIHKSYSTDKVNKNNCRQTEHKFIVLGFMVNYFHSNEHRDSSAAESGNHKEVFRYSLFSFFSCFFVVNSDDNGKNTYYNVKT